MKQDTLPLNPPLDSNSAPKTSSPLVSVVIPAYNRVALTIKTIESILNQTYKPIEIIVVDDGSKDDTTERLAMFGDKIQYIRKENGGACSARNAGIKVSRGKYIGLIDCDDQYMPEKIELSVKYFEEHPACGMVHTAAQYIDENEKVIHKSHLISAHVSGQVKHRLIINNFVNNATVVVRRECFERAGLYAEEMFPPADWDMWLRIAEHYAVGYIDRPLSKYLIASNGCYQDAERTDRECLAVLEKFFKRNPETNGRIKRRAYVRHHLSMVGYHTLKNNDGRVHEEFRKAFALEPFYWKTILMWAGYHFARNALKRKIASKYFVKID